MIAGKSLITGEGKGMPNRNRLCTIRHHLTAALTVTFCLLTAPTLADTPQGNLVIHASGFADSSGQAVANLFLKDENVLEKPHIRISAAIQDGMATMSFPNVAYGSYAVTVYHDKNGNNEIDHNLLHMPSEPLGFSNGFKLGLFSGLPSYEKLHFEFSADTKPLDIVVK